MNKASTRFDVCLRAWGKHLQYLLEMLWVDTQYEVQYAELNTWTRTQGKLKGVRVAGWSPQHGYHSNPTIPKLQHTSNQEQYDQCGNSAE